MSEATGIDSVETTTEVVADTEVAPEPQATTTEAPAEVLDLDAYGNYVVPIKVDGEELTVPVREATQGYMRQSDYTRKTQELADARIIQEALESNPAETLKILSDVYGIEAVAPAEVQQEAPEELDPTQRALQEIQEWKAQIEQAELEASIRTDLGRIEGETGIPGDELLRFALESNITDLDIAASHFMRSREDVYKQHAEAKAKADAERVAAKEQASFIAGGGSPAAGSVSEGPVKYGNFREAMRAAMQQHGVY